MRHNFLNYRYFTVIRMVHSPDDLVKSIRDMQSRRKDFRNRSLNNLILSKLKKGNMLDVGCAAGYLVYCAKQKGIDAVGLEPNKKLIEISKRYYKGLPIINKSAEEIGEIKQKFDNITMVDVLEYTDDDNLVIKKIYNKLRPNGRFIINVPTLKFLHVERTKKVGDRRRYSRRELTSILKRNNFKIKEVRYWNFLGFWATLIIEKILKKELSTDLGGLRSDHPKGVKKYINKLLSFWFGEIENNINFGVGLSLLCVAEKK